MKLRPFARASFWQAARLAMAILSAAAISPGLLGFAGAVCGSAGPAPNRRTAIIV